MARRFERRACAARLAEERGFREIGAARVGDRRDAHAAAAFVRRGEAFQPAHAGLAQALGVGHDVGLRHGDEVLRAEELADLDLVLEREPGHRAELSGEDASLFFAQPHGARIVARKPLADWRRPGDRSRFCGSSWRRPPHACSDLVCFPASFLRNRARAEGRRGGHRRRGERPERPRSRRLGDRRDHRSARPSTPRSSSPTTRAATSFPSCPRRATTSG